MHPELVGKRDPHGVVVAPSHPVRPELVEVPEHPEPVEGPSPVSRWWLANLALCLVSLASLPAHAVPTFQEVQAQYRPSDVTLLDRHGTPLQTVRTDSTVRRLPWVALQDMSPALLHALVLSEDRRFHEHSGVDWGAAARSAWGNLWNTRTRGASTITMQLAGLIDADLARPAGGRSVAQKLGQTVTAKRLESSWTKSQILEAYLNNVGFRGEIVGINALSQTLFGKHPSGLDWQEAAITVALVRGPNANATTVAQRACGVLTLQALPCTGVTALTETALVRPGGMPLGEQLAPHFARHLLQQRPPTAAATSSLTTSLDARVQRVAIEALQRQLTELNGHNVEDGAVLVLDNATGDVLAWVGSSGSLSGASQVDGVLARRQPGSTLKPFVYGLAFERRLITPATMLDDSPTQIATTAGLYLPQNYDRRYTGWVSARMALGASLNVPAVRVGTLLGPDALFQRFNDLGMALPGSGGHYGASLALGSADVTLLALTNAYRTLANGGLHRPVSLGPASGVRVGAPRRVAPAASTYLVTAILADNNARVRTFGLDSPLSTRGFSAVKTGTSKDMRDNWCIGFTDRYTVGVWVGNASGEPMHNVSGISGAAPVWHAMAKYLHTASPSRAPALPPGVVQALTTFDAAREPAREEVFLAGTQPPAPTRGQAHIRLADGPRQFGITSPRQGSLFALDPDIPPTAQRIRFAGEHGTWVLNGWRIGSGDTLDWAPWPGRHELRLLNAQGQLLQAVQFEVRGAGVKTAAKGRP